MEQHPHSRFTPESRRLPQPGPAAIPATYSEPAAYGYGNLPDVGEEVETGGLLEYWRILRRRKGTLILIAFAGALIGFLITLPQTPVYQARASVEIVGLNENFLNIKQVNPVTQTGTTPETSDIQTQIKIFQSESLMERVLAKLKPSSKLLEDTALEEGTETGRVSAWRKALNLPEPVKLDPQESALKMAAKNLKVRAAGQTRIIEILADSTDRKVAADFANTLANEFIEQNLESRWKTTERTGEWLTRQLDDMRIKLERSEDQLQQYARHSGLIFTSEKNNVTEEKLKQVQQALSAAQAERVARQSRFEMANNSPPEALPDVLNDTGLRDYQSKLTDLRRQVAELAGTFTPEHYKVQRVQAQMATLEAALERERGAILKRIRNEYEEAVRKEKLLATAYDEQARQLTGESEKSIQYNILKREVDSNRALYDAMLQRLKEASIAAAMRASNVRVVDAAKPPKRPYKPDVLLSAGLGLLSGIFLGAAFIVMREHADRTLQQPGDAAFYLNTAELGIIPAGQSEHGKRLSRKLLLGGGSGNGNGAGNGNGSGPVTDLTQRVELVTWQQKASMISESFRSTLISILFAGDNSSRPRVLVLTSSGPAEGKSTVSSNLAIAIAEVGQRVLLIDADMRKPRMHQIFGVENKQGLSELLKDRQRAASVTVAELLKEGTIQEMAVPGLFLLPSGAGTSAATNLLYSAQMPGLLKRFREMFDTVVIDTPPMLQIPDARVLGRMADTVILVVRAGATTRDAALAARQRFAEDGTNLLGVILNDWNPNSSPNGYYGYYDGYYKNYSRYYGKNS